MLESFGRLLLLVVVVVVVVVAVASVQARGVLKIRPGVWSVLEVRA